MQFLPYGSIERIEKSAIGPLRIRAGSREAQQCAILKYDDFLDIPSIPAHGDDVAGGKRLGAHALSIATGVPEGCARCGSARGAMPTVLRGLRVYAPSALLAPGAPPAPNHPADRIAIVAPR